MKRIKTIKILNFKAFQQEQIFDIGGKNVLIYGNNGSGKSSLFWALYTFLQSSIKSDSDVQKYFKNFDELNRLTHQTLKNIFVDEEQNAFIELTTIDKETQREQVYKISHDIINTNNDGDTTIQELNLASDFINYKLLHNFYRASHKQEVNLWPIFERDIFPFLTEGTKSWIDIIKEKTEDVPRLSNGAVISKEPKIRYVNEIDSLNDWIQERLDEISQNTNDFIKSNFYNNKDILKVDLKFKKKFRFENIKQKIWKDTMQFFRHNNLHIELIVSLFNENNESNWTPLHRVQSFLNEAQLTRIAIGIRIGALRTRVQSTDFKILVLDDMLISLDLSNRVAVVRMILNKEGKENLKFFDTFQKIIMTHDKGFFNLIRRHTDEEEWVYFNFNKKEDDNNPPKIKFDKTPLQKAISYFEENEYDNCGNELRKEAEAILTHYLDPDMKKLNNDFESLSDKLNKAYNKLITNKFNKFKTSLISNLPIETVRKIKTDFESDQSLSEEDKTRLSGLLNRTINYLIEINEKKDIKESLIKEVKEVLDRVMNASSHHTENPLYEQELKDAIEKIKNLKLHLQSN